MRVTTFGINTLYLGDLNNIMSKYQNLEQQLSTGRKLNDPSDDPVAFESDIQAQTSIQQVDQWQSNAKQASEQMSNLDDVMNTLQSQLGNLRTSIVQILNGTNTPSDFGNLLASVKQQVLAVAQSGNASDGQQYIFTGINGKPVGTNGQPTVPIDTSSGQLVWTAGATPAQLASVGNKVQVQRNVSGQQLFATAPSNSPTSPDLITSLNQIVTDLQGAATAPNTSTMQASVQNLRTDLGNLDANIDNVSAMRADLGGRMDRVNALQKQLAQSTNALTKQKSDAEDADLAQVMTQLTTQQTVYQAALMSGQKLILPTLADVLK